MIKYAIPGMYELKDINFKILKMKREHPDFFYDNVDIEYCYGNPQFCIWDGGRIFGKYIHTSANEISSIIDKYNNDFNIPIRYVFTNCALKEEHYKNRFGNILMLLGSKKYNEVVVADDNFMKYLKEHYPSYGFVSSTTKCILDKEEVKKELHKEDYKLVCLDYNLNRNINFLKSFSEEEKNKTELLINSICPPGCAQRKNHYFLNSMSHLNFGRTYKMEYCGITENTFYPEVKKHHLVYEDLRDIYEPMGFEHFKIEGRTWDNLSIALTYCNYMIKPEYKDYVLMNLVMG